MSLISVQAVLKTALDGYHTPLMDTYNIKPFNCYIAPPQVVTDTLTAPEVYIWGGKADTHRGTAPRSIKHTGGFKISPWKFDIWVFFIDSIVAGGDNVSFPAILDGIRRAIEDIPYPQTLTDNDSEPTQTQLVMVAEDLDLEQPPPTMLEDQSNLLHTAHIMCAMREDYQA